LPDLTRLRAFKIALGQGVCMRAGCWHASFVLGGQVTCLMLTRRSTTQELVAHLARGSVAAETSMVELAGLDEAEWRLAV
jgi:ureidoglycolate lyase